MIPAAWLINSQMAFLYDTSMSSFNLLSIQQLRNFGTWLINFQMVLLFYTILSSVYLLSIQQLRKLIAEM